MPDKKYKDIEEWVNENLTTLNDFVGQPPPLLLPAPAGDWDINPNHLALVAQLARANGLPVDEDIVQMAALALTEVDKIKQLKINTLLWQYIIILMFNAWVQTPDQQKFSLMKSAFLMGLATERTLEWEVDEDP